MSEIQKHTPGPWRFDRVSGDRIVAEHFVVALVTRGVDDQSGDDLGGPVFEANARLVAAAPEMYEALKAVYEHEFIPYQDLPPEKRNREWPELRVQIEAALAKAEGK